MILNEKEIGLDTLSMYRPILPPDYFTHPETDKIHEVTSEIVQVKLMNAYRKLEGFQKEQTTPRKGRLAIRKIMIRDFLKINKWENLRLHYDILNIKVHYAPKGNMSYHAIIFTIKVPNDDNNSYVIISPQVQINANTKIQISTSVYGFHFKNPACLDKDIDWPIAIMSLREYLDQFWDALRKDIGLKLDFILDNHRWVVSRFDCEMDISTMNQSHSFYLLERFADSSLPGYDRGEYRAGKSIKFHPKGVLRKKNNSLEIQNTLAKLPSVMIYEKSLELQREHQKKIPSTIRVEKEYDRIAQQHPQARELKRRITSILNYQDGMEDDSVLDNDEFLKLLYTTFTHKDHVIPLVSTHFQNAQRKLQELPINHLDDLRLLEIIHRHNGTGSMRTYAEVMDTTKYFVEKSMKRLAQHGLVYKAHQKWCVKEKAVDILRGNYHELVNV